MNRRPDQDDHSTSHVPDLDDYTPVREISLRKNMMDALTKRPPKTDRDISRCEDYLRTKWGCTDAIPDAFDPYKLDAALRLRFPAKNRQERSDETREQAPGPTVQPQDDDPPTAPTEPQDTPLEDAYVHSPESVYSCGCNASYESLNTDEQNIGYDSEVCTSDDEAPESTRPTRSRSRSRSNSNTSSRRGRTRSGTPEQTSSTPRIRTGSKPPLSRSAFVEGGVPCLDKQCQGACKRGVVVRGRSKPPPYFPFKGRVRRSSRSKGRESRR
ncbi:hypothetical protein E0Z10_g5645 [Xylaria hypoxylon]|uniref:Uncharacterized protein n=1 Tax=Xylaria hypoxylon TaxID=37992 RepID=A0A4Z0YGH3_9PEZI|nr:hypothetical protein E0Z10_g5645 [Xylaria hypoxylon]